MDSTKQFFSMNLKYFRKKLEAAEELSYEKKYFKEVVEMLEGYKHEYYKRINKEKRKFKQRLLMRKLTTIED